MTFSRNYLMQTAAPFIAVSTVGLPILFALFLHVPPMFAFLYGIMVITLDIMHLVKAVAAIKTTDFEYTILYGSKYLVIKLANGERHLYRRNELNPGKDNKYFWLQDGENKHLYPYTDKVVAFLDQLA